MTTQTAQTEWLSVTECADEVGINRKTLLRNIKSGKVDVRAVHVTPHLVRVYRADWQKWIRTHTVNAAASADSV